jgi:transcriptional regulator with GAF, ATPase, and Fis domain
MLSAGEPIAGTRGSRVAYYEVSLELLGTIANVLDIRPVLPQVSSIVEPILPHDALSLASLERDGQVVVDAVTGDLPGAQPLAFRTPLPEEFIIGDLTSEPLPVVRGIDPTPRLVASGYRSVLGVSMRVGDQTLGLAFWSKQRHAYRRCDVSTARQIADHLAVAVSHERLATTAHAGAGAHGRATPFDGGRRPPATGACLAPHGRAVGESAEWQEALAKAARVAQTETTVLLTGESGTGKEVVARLIHRASARRSGPFVALNCAALPEQLLEAELFGYERGAFTGAQQAKPGQIELAAGGVLFLDEVSEMSLSAQAKFLRVLQEREFQRLGGTRPLKANIRVLAATNRDLRQAVAEGDFRADLFYRLQVFDIHLAPLRDRRADILPLSDAFLHDLGTAFGRPPATLTREARQALLAYPWPGNVRELRNALERAAIVCDDGLIRPEHLSLEPPAAPPRRETTDLGAMERDTIAKVLQACRWNKTDAARRLGLSRTQLYVRMRRYSLDQAAPA